MQPGEGALDDVAHDAEAGAMRCATAGDARGDLQATDRVAVFLVVIAAVGVEITRASARLPALAADLRDRLDQRQQLGDVVPVAAGEQHRQRDAVRVGDQVVLRTRPSPIDGRGARLGPPFSALTWDASTTATSSSSTPCRRNSSSSTRCSSGHTPASVQSRSRRQQVTPEQPATSRGTSRQVTPVLSTYTIPANAPRSSNGSRPALRERRAGRSGSNGATLDHNASGTSSSLTRPASIRTRILGQLTRRHYETSS